MSMIDILRQHYFPRSETTSRHRKISGCHTKGYANTDTIAVIQGNFSFQLFHNFEIKLLCFVVAMHDLVHDAEAIHGLC